MNTTTKKIIAGLILVVALILVLQQCNNNKYQQLKGEYSVLKEWYSTKKDEVLKSEEKRLKEKDSLIKRNQILKSLKDKSNKTVIILEEKIRDRKAQSKKELEKVKNLSLIQVAQKIDSVYNTNQAVATNTSVNLSGNLPNKVLSTLYENNDCKKTIVDKDNIILEQRKTISYSNEQIENTSFSLMSAEFQIREQEKLQEIGEKNIKNLEKQNKKLRTKSTLSKILIPIVFIGGGYLGTQIK